MLSQCRGQTTTTSSSYVFSLCTEWTLASWSTRNTTENKGFQGNKNKRHLTSVRGAWSASKVNGTYSFSKQQRQEQEHKANRPKHKRHQRMKSQTLIDNTHRPLLILHFKIDHKKKSHLTKHTGLYFFIFIYLKCIMVQKYRRSAAPWYNLQNKYTIQTKINYRKSF